MCPAMNRRLAAPLLLTSLVALAVVASPASAKLVGFQTPDKKVGCYMDGQGARCDVKKQEWTAPPPSMPCELDYGFGVFVDRHNPAGYVCAGDTTLDRKHEVLEEGDKLKTGRFKCKNVGEDTIKCVNTRTKDGFLVSQLEAELLPGS